MWNFHVFHKISLKISVNLKNSNNDKFLDYMEEVVYLLV